MENRSVTRAVLPLDGGSKDQWTGAEVALNRVLTTLALWRQEDMFDDRWNVVYSLDDAAFVKFMLPDDLEITLARGPYSRGSKVTMEISGIAPHNFRKAKRVQSILDRLPFHDDRRDR
jgi:hypothetical protein